MAYWASFLLHFAVGPLELFAGEACHFIITFPDYFHYFTIFAVISSLISRLFLRDSFSLFLSFRHYFISSPSLISVFMYYYYYTLLLRHYSPLYIIMPWVFTLLRHLYIFIYFHFHYDYYVIIIFSFRLFRFSAFNFHFFDYFHYFLLHLMLALYFVSFSHASFSYYFDFFITPEVFLFLFHFGWFRLSILIFLASH